MRMPRVRFTVRRLMVTVVIAAFVALQFHAKSSQQKRQHFLGMAGDYSVKESAAMAFNPDSPAARLGYWDTKRGFRQVKHENLDYYRRLRQKYEHAARYPWFLVAPDPPEPE